MKKDTSMNKKVIIGTLMGCLFGATVGYSASVVSLPHTFTAGTSIKASEVNANFSALAQEIASVKSSLSLSKSSNFTEMAITPISTAVGSMVTVDSKSFIIKQKSGIEDPITGKKYILNYPVPSAPSDNDSTSIMATNCKSLMDNEIVVSLGNGNGFTSYVYYKSYISTSSTPSSAAGFTIQVSDNICAYIKPSDSATDTTRTTAIQMINRATELQKYILVQEA